MWVIFYIAMSNKPAYSIADQISLLKQRGMLFRDEGKASHFLENISYYRLKGYIRTSRILSIVTILTVSFKVNFI